MWLIVPKPRRRPAVGEGREEACVYRSTGQYYAPGGDLTSAIGSLRERFDGYPRRVAGSPVAIPSAESGVRRAQREGSPCDERQAGVST